MQMTYDDVTGAVYVYFSRTPSARTVRLSENTLIDYDKDGQIIGIELLYANEGIDLSGLRALSQLPAVERLLSDRAFPVLTA